jgi:hypothetical protein
MTEHDTTARNSKQPPSPAEVTTESGELGEELSRFARRLASFGLGEALDALLARQHQPEPGSARQDPDPEPV